MENIKTIRKNNINRSKTKQQKIHNYKRKGKERGGL